MSLLHPIHHQGWPLFLLMIMVRGVVMLYIIATIALYVGENSIVIISGANGCLATDDVVNASSLVASAKVVVCQLEVPLATTAATLKMAKQHGGTYTMSEPHNTVYNYSYNTVQCCSQCVRVER